MPLVPASQSLKQTSEHLSSLIRSHHLMHCSWDSDLLEKGIKEKKAKVECFNVNWKISFYLSIFFTSYHQYFSSNYADKAFFGLYIRARFYRHHVWLLNCKRELHMRRCPTHVYDFNIYYENELRIHLKCLERPFSIMEGILDCDSVHLGFSPRH